MIIVDTRERKWGHIRNWLEMHGIDYECKKLDFGDYMLPGGRVTVDRKRNLDELAGNLCTKDKRRFWNEIRGASRAGLHVVVLCEHGQGIESPHDVLNWRSNNTKITGEMVFSEMFNMSVAYGVEFLFCDTEQTGQRIAKILELDCGK